MEEQKNNAYKVQLIELDNGKETVKNLKQNIGSLQVDIFILYHYCGFSLFVARNCQRLLLIYPIYITFQLTIEENHRDIETLKAERDQVSYTIKIISYIISYKLVTLLGIE